VIIVDSASADSTLALAQAAAAADPRFHVLENPAGEPASSRNLGVAAARGARLAFTDADCTPEPNWLHAGLEALDRADLVQGRVLPAGAHGRFDRTLSVGPESGLYETANLLMLPEVFEKAGGFAPLPSFAEERPFGEDTWFAWRARRAGVSTAYGPDVVVRHAVFPRGAGAYIAERRRCAYFPALVRAVPELREAFLYHRVFLSRQSAAFDLALGGLALAALSRRPAALAATLPYLATLPLSRPGEAGAEVVADAVGAAALVKGSLTTRAPVL
jgi:glycosyltransferase involved in cell wall biosynthesis